VALLALLDSAGIPIVGGVDVVLTVVAAANPAVAYVSASLATVVSVIGCLILFWLARKGGECYLQTHTASPKARTLTLWFQRYGLATVFVTALSPIPLPTKVFVVCAGATGVRVAPFVLVVLAARAVRYFGLAYLGARYGRAPLDWLIAHGWYVAAAALGLFVLAAVVFKVGGRLLRRTSPSPSS
jgi:membrane protein YqaA with SNARE-associated domain